MKLIKLLFVILFFSLIIFAACESDKNETTDDENVIVSDEIKKNNNELVIDSLNNLLRSYEAEEKKFSGNDKEAVLKIRKKIKEYNKKEATLNKREKIKELVIDSLNTLLRNYEEEEKKLSQKITVLQTKLDKLPPPPQQEVKVVYKTKIKYKTDSSVLVELEQQKRKVQNQLAEIEQLKNAISKKESRLNKMQSEVKKLEEKNSKMFTDNEVTKRIDSIIKIRLTVSEIDVELYTSRIKDRKRKYLFIEVIEVAFTINKNKFAEKGNKVVYLCIYDNNSNVLHHKENQTFELNEGNKQYYTAKDKFFYGANDDLRMILFWEKRNVELTPGIYTTEFYIDNVLSGVGTFNVE